jgi:hypothetical protein
MVRTILRTQNGERMINAMIRKQIWQMHWRQVLLGTVKIFSITLKQRADASVVGYSGEGVASCAVGPSLEIISVSLARLHKVEIALMVKRDTFAFRQIPLLMAAFEARSSS